MPYQGLECLDMAYTRLPSVNNYVTNMSLIATVLNLYTVLLISMTEVTTACHS